MKASVAATKIIGTGGSRENRGEKKFFQDRRAGTSLAGGVSHRMKSLAIKKIKPRRTQRAQREYPSIDSFSALSASSVVIHF